MKDEGDGAKDVVDSGYISQQEAEALRKRAHECPMPRPSGRIGQVLGYKKAQEDYRDPDTQIEARAADRMKEIPRR